MNNFWEWSAAVSSKSMKSFNVIFLMYCSFVCTDNCTGDEFFLSQRSERFFKFSILNLGIFWLLVKRSNNSYILLLVQKQQWRCVVVSQGGRHSWNFRIPNIWSLRSQPWAKTKNSMAVRAHAFPETFSSLRLWNGISCILRELLSKM